ncbi:MAG TPA: SAM-dependent methyltransferase [Streptosporangiaceae bacterium]
MADQQPADPLLGDLPALLNPAVAHPARVYDYWLGGTNNFAADREAAEQVIAVRPSIRTEVRANRAFLGRAVRYLTAEAGIRQFLDVGTGLPSADNTHEVAQSVAPETRVVYADNDPIVLVHGRALLTSTPEGATAYADADLRDTGRVLAAARRTLDLGEPVAVMLIAMMHNVSDDDDPYGIVARLVDAVAPGSYLVLSQPASDIDVAAVTEVARRYNARVPAGQRRRSRDEVARFFRGLEVLEPGIVATTEWRPTQPAGPAPVPMWAGVGRKPGAGA